MEYLNVVVYFVLNFIIITIGTNVAQNVRGVFFVFHAIFAGVTLEN